MPAQIEVMEECCTWHHQFAVKSSSLPDVWYTVTMNGPEGGAHCTCLAFLHSKDNNCKHIEQVFRDDCFWHQQWSDEDLKIKGQCPRCGKSTVLVRVAV